MLVEGLLIALAVLIGYPLLMLVIFAVYVFIKDPFNDGRFFD